MKEFKPILESIQDIDNRLNYNSKDPTLSDIIGESFPDFFKKSKKYHRQDDDLDLAHDIKKNRNFLIIEYIFTICLIAILLYMLFKYNMLVISNLILSVFYLFITICETIKFFKVREKVLMNSFFAPYKIEFSLKDKIFRYKRYGTGIYGTIKYVLCFMSLFFCFSASFAIMDKDSNMIGYFFIFYFILLVFNIVIMSSGVQFSYDTFVMESEDKYLISSQFFSNFRRVDKK